MTDGRATGLATDGGVEKGKRRRKCLFVVLAVLAGSIMSLCATVPAFAGLPTGDFSAFGDCPFGAPNTQCMYITITGGEIKIGSISVPINRDIVLQGGIVETADEEIFVGADDGNTLSPTAVEVPGGLRGLPTCRGPAISFARAGCEAIPGGALSSLTATAELAAPASSISIAEVNVINGSGVVLSLPLKFRLKNPSLGSTCYIGSSAHPVTLNFTDGKTSPPPPNRPISGRTGELSLKDHEEYLELPHTVLVDNSFSIPAAQGCGGVDAYRLDPLIDARLGLPAAAGSSTAIFAARLQVATAVAVEESEK